MRVAPLEPDVGELEPAGRRPGDQQAKHGVGSGQPQGAAEQEEDSVLERELRQEPPPGRAQNDPQGELAAPAHGADEEEPGDIGAAEDEQRQPRRLEERQGVGGAGS